MENVDPAASRSTNIIRENHPDLYFATGDVVLQAKLPSDAEQQKFQMYCVHKAILSFHSVVFSNLFADGSATLEQNYDGQPLMDMSDEAHDLSRLLLYVYKPSEYLLRPRHPDTPIELGGAVRLAGKYVMDQARADMIKRVTMDWPATLEDWDAREAENTVHDQYYWQGPSSRSFDGWVDHTPEPVSAIVFAQENGCTEILPIAFYRLAAIDVDADWGGFYVRDPGLRARWTLCDKDHVMRWIRGRKALAGHHYLVRLALRRGHMLSVGCTAWWILNPPDLEAGEEPFEPDMADYPCLHFLWTLRDLVWGTRPSHNPLRTLAQLDPHNHDTLRLLKKTCPKGLCSKCEDSLQSWIRDERERVWKRLPEFFKLQ